MHNLEGFATEIYGAQFRAFQEKVIADRFNSAMDNEQEHVNDLRVRIEELGGLPYGWGSSFRCRDSCWD